MANKKKNDWQFTGAIFSGTKNISFQYAYPHAIYDIEFKLPRIEENPSSKNYGKKVSPDGICYADIVTAVKDLKIHGYGFDDEEEYNPSRR